MRWLRNAPIRRKLALIIAVPLTTVLALTGLEIAGTVAEASAAGRLADLVRLSADAAALADGLQQERMAAIDAVGDPATASRFDRAARSTDGLVRRYRRHRAALSVPGGVRGALADADRVLDTLGPLRTQVAGRQAVGAAIALRYQVMIADLDTYRQAVAQQAGSSGAGNRIRAAAMLSEAKQDVAYEQAVAYLGLRAGTLGPDEREAVQAALHGQEQSLLTFLQVATADQQALVTASVAGDAVELADRLTAQLASGTGPAVPADDARRSLGAVVTLMRTVETELDGGVAAAVGDYQWQVGRRGLAEGAAVASGLLLTLLVTLLLARLMSRSLSRLRYAADQVAHRHLPESVAALGEPGRTAGLSPADAAARAYRPIPVTDTDEIGQVAVAFNGVQREAIRIAVEQAVLRGNVSATFVNLARRSQKLVDKMIAHLDGVERDEAEPGRLAQLFALDHLATRMRRNDENLLILADADAGEARRHDAALADVLAAAQSEIAYYDRVRIGPPAPGVHGETGVRAAAVNDVVRLLAELLENATSFSAPATVVTVTARPVADRVIVEIEDEGIGLTRQRTEEINARLARPEPVASGEPGVLRMMGFAVVGRLAGRHRIHVELGPRTGAHTGTVAYVVLPAALLVHRPAEAVPAAGSPPVPEASWFTSPTARVLRTGADPT